MKRKHKNTPTTLACPSGPGRLEAAIAKEVAKLNVLNEDTDGINVRDIFVDYTLGDEDHNNVKVRKPSRL